MKKINKGFTLIELLVVIAIIGILSSIAIVNLNSAREKARNAAAVASLNALQAAMALCLDSNGVAVSSDDTPCDNTAAPVSDAGNVPICEVNSTPLANIGSWPDIDANGFAYGNCDFDETLSQWSYGADKGDAAPAGCHIACTDSGGCVRTGTDC